MPGAASNDAAWGAPVEAHEVQELGRYTLRQAMDHTGLGAWFEAWDQDQGCVVALYLPADQAEAQARARSDALFLAAMQPGAALQHPYVATVVDVGLGPRGPYLATAWMAGRSLAQALQSGWRPPLSRAVLLMQRVALALAHAHQHGVCHGALDPGNVWLLDDATPKLRAFGVAAGALASALPELDPLVIGPGHYLAPEQLLGETVDERTDVHAVGALLYELLTGVQAYPGHTVSQVAHALLKLRPRAPHLLRPELPLGLSEIVMRALQRAPTDRYHSAAELAGALGAWLKDTPSPEEPQPLAKANSAMPAAVTSQVRWWASKVFTAGAALAAAIGLWFAWSGAGR